VQSKGLYIGSAQWGVAHFGLVWFGLIWFGVYYTTCIQWYSSSPSGWLQVGRLLSIIEEKTVCLGHRRMNE
jgi:hypothetical protein